MTEGDSSFERGKFEGQVLAVLSRIEGSIEALTIAKNDDHEKFEKRFTIAEFRVTRLENWRFYLLGVFVTISLLAGTLKDYVIRTIFHV